MDLSKPNGTQFPLPNGLPAKPHVEQDGGHIREHRDKGARNGAIEEMESQGKLMNGVVEDAAHLGPSVNAMSRPNGLPPEVRRLTEHFRPFHKLIHRSVQQTWNTFSEMIEQLSEMDASTGGAASKEASGKSQINGAISKEQSPKSLEKKDRLLNFQQDRRALYIKLLVLHDWFRKSQGVDHAIELSAWIHEQRVHFSQSADFVGNMKRELPLWQVPNPDLRTAIEVLSEGKVSAFSDLGYAPKKPLSPQVILRTLRDLNVLLCTRLRLREQIPLSLSKYRIHDGRVTFTVPHEFELDLSVGDEDPSSQFFFIDFRLLFLQRLLFGNDRLHDDFAAKVNELLRTNGLLACYQFLHDLTLSFKLSGLRRQVIDMARKQWSDSLKIDFINRTLVVQYWSNRPMSKSWIEIGINSGRRGKYHQVLRPGESFLELRWKPEKKERHDIDMELNATPLSAESILRGVISRHSSIIIERLYEKLLGCKHYGEGRLALDLFCSATNPNDCTLGVQLTGSKHTTFAVEPISGSLISKPASSLSGRIEFELNRLRSPAEEGVGFINMLRCLAAEQEVARQASLGGWEIPRALQLTQHELKTIFPPNMLRYVLLRQPSWQSNILVAATFSADEDSWWLLYPDGSDCATGSSTILSHRVDGFMTQNEEETDPAIFFSKLREYASAGITFKVAERDLTSKRVSYQSSSLPRLGLKFRPPFMKIQYRYVFAKQVLNALTLGEQTQDADLVTIGVARDDIDSDNLALIQPTIIVRFCGLNRTTNNVVLLAKGRTTASTRVLQSLDRSTTPVPKVVGDAGEFLTTFQLPIGTSFVSSLLTRLQNFEKLLSCLAVIQSFDSMRIQSLSLSQILVEYDREAELSMAIDSQPSPSTVTIRLLPVDGNPHSRVAKFIENQIADVRRPFAANLGGILTMLTTTRPLLSLFNELENPRTSTETVDVATVPPHPIIRLHVIARSPTHFALQYFDLSPTSRTMIARLEIFRHLRRDNPVWILRAAHEEAISYPRSSFIDDSLRQEIKDRLFKVKGDQGWLGLDTGASCPIDHPEDMVKKADGLVRTWAKQSLKDVLASQGQKQGAEGSRIGPQKTANGSTPQGNDNSKSAQQPPQPKPQQPQKSQQPPRQPPAAASRPLPGGKPAQSKATTGNNPPRRRAPPPQPPPSQQQQQQQQQQKQHGQPKQQQQPQPQQHQQPDVPSQDVITLD